MAEPTNGSETSDNWLQKNIAGNGATTSKSQGRNRAAAYSSDAAITAQHHIANKEGSLSMTSAQTVPGMNRRRKINRFIMPNLNNAKKHVN